MKGMGIWKNPKNINSFPNLLELAEEHIFLTLEQQEVMIIILPLQKAEKNSMKMVTTGTKYSCTKKTSINSLKH